LSFSHQNSSNHFMEKKLIMKFKSINSVINFENSSSMDSFFSSKN